MELKFQSPWAARLDAMEPRLVSRSEVKLAYAKFRDKFFSDDDLPDFESLDFEFEDCPEEWGYVSWDEHGNPNLSIGPEARKYRDILIPTLLHEMMHIKLGPKWGHGNRFYDEALRVANAGGIRYMI